MRGIVTIKAGGYQKFTVRTIRQFPGRIRGGKNSWPMVLLRPHRRNAGGAGEAGNIHYIPFDEGTRWYLRNAKEYFDTRAQAAKEAYG